MASRIKVLDDQTINQIAAGEVIENPASVVKELVENSIDAGSTEISIEIKAGGRQLIVITDNGCGMSRDDVLLSLERHATSKIRDLNDIYSIGTMGFRGEAVPSIASISKMTILSCEGDEKEATLAMIEGGKILSCNKAVRSRGTTIEVKSLFFNVPVRKKFQRSPAYDAAEILKVVSMQALAHPEIKFTLIHNQKDELITHLPEHEEFLNNLKDRISGVLGSDFKAALREVTFEKEPYHIKGFIGLPTYTRHNRTGQFLFINKRAVVSPLISFAIREGYGPALASNRHPVFVLHLTMPCANVDVNVHPQKREVRIHQEQSLKEMLIRSIETALQKTEYYVKPQPQPYFETRPYPFSNLENPFSFTKSTEIAPPVIPYNFTPQPPATPEPLHHEPEPLFKNFEFPVPVKKAEVSHQPPQVIATMQGYLLVQTISKTLRVVDHQAAHRRIIYDRLLNQESDSTVASQNLLIPETLETTPVEAAIIRNHIDNFNQLGIVIQEFGEQTFIVQAIPTTLKNVNLYQWIQEMIHDLQEGYEATLQDKTKKIANAASRAALSQKQTISLQEGQELLNQLFKCQQPYLCPNGNPIIIDLCSEDLAKQFQKCK